VQINFCAGGGPGNKGAQRAVDDPEGVVREPRQQPGDHESHEERGGRGLEAGVLAQLGGLHQDVADVVAQQHHGADPEEPVQLGSGLGSGFRWVGSQQKGPTIGICRRMSVSHVATNNTRQPAHECVFVWNTHLPGCPHIMS